MKIIKLLSLIIIATSFTSCEEEDFISFPKTDSNIIFISRRIDNSADWNLFLMNIDGTNQKKITDLTVRCEKPVISHSGETVLFVHSSDENFYELYSIKIDGTNLTLIDRAKRYCGSPDWSVDDSKIIYSKSRNESTDDKDIILFDVITNNKITLTKTGNNILARFSKDNKIAFLRKNDTSNDIFTMDIDGSNKKKILTNACYPVWSPGGKRIAYISYVFNSTTEIFGSPQIFTACFDGSNSKQLTETYLPCWDSGFPTFGNYNPIWAPDCEKIVYVSRINEGLPEIYIMNSDGSNQQRLTNTDRLNELPELSSDGKLIYFTSNRDLTYGFDIFVMGIDGSDQHPLSKYSGDDCHPVLRRK